MSGSKNVHVTEKRSSAAKDGWGENIYIHACMGGKGRRVATDDGNLTCYIGVRYQYRLTKVHLPCNVDYEKTCADDSHRSKHNANCWSGAEGCYSRHDVTPSPHLYTLSNYNITMTSRSL